VPRSHLSVPHQMHPGAPVTALLDAADAADVARILTRLVHELVERQPASSAAAIAACRSECGEIALSIPARFASRRTIRPAACRSKRLPSPRASSGPSLRSPTALSIARIVLVS
jgi:hypothetical protein